jgi:hypothetical protein
MSILRALDNTLKEVSFYKKVVVIIISTKITLIFKKFFSFMKYLTNSLRAYR